MNIDELKKNALAAIITLATVWLGALIVVELMP